MFIGGAQKKKYLVCPTHGDMGASGQMVETAKSFDLELRFCPVCGARVKCVEREIADEDFRCGKCDRPVSNKWHFCIYCGEKGTK